MQAAALACDASRGRSSGRASAGLHVSPAFVRHGGRFGDAGDGVAMNVPVQWPVSPIHPKTAMGVAILPASTQKAVDEAVVGGGTTLASLRRVRRADFLHVRGHYTETETPR
jgi:hypothetical protein